MHEQAKCYTNLALASMRPAHWDLVPVHPGWWKYVVGVEAMDASEEEEEDSLAN